MYLVRVLRLHRGVMGHHDHREGSPRGLCLYPVSDITDMYLSKHLQMLKEDT